MPSLYPLIFVGFVSLLTQFVAIGFSDDDWQPILVAADREPLPASLERIEGDQCFFRCDRQSVQQSFRTSFHWGVTPSGTEGAAVIMADGSQLRCNVRSIGPNSVQLRSRHWTLDSISRLAVQAILLTPDSNPIEFDRSIAELLGNGSREKDRIYLIGGDIILGQLESLARPAKSDRNSPGVLSVKTENGLAMLTLDRVAGIRFANTVKPQKPRRRWASLLDGSRIAFRSIERKENRLVFDCWFGGKIQSSASFEETSIGAFVRGLESWEGTRFLSELKPQSYRFQPLISGKWEYRLDGNVMGGQLRSKRSRWGKGIGMHSKSRLTWILDQPYQRFQSGVAIDASSGGRGSVVCKVWLLKGDQWSVGWQSDVVRGGDEVEFIDLPLTDVKAIALDVDFADQGDTGDRLNWLMPRLMESPKSDPK